MPTPTTRFRLKSGLMDVVGGRSTAVENSVHSLDLFQKDHKAGSSPPYNFNSLDGRDGRSLLQESVGLP